MQWKHYAAAAVLALSLVPAAAGAFDYNMSVDEVSEHPLTAYNTVYLAMPKADFARNFAVLPDWTFYASDGTSEKAERTTTDGKATIIEGLSITTANGTTQGKTIAFENYFKSNDRKIARKMYDRLAATIYSNMEDFPYSQSDDEITWVQNDVTIVTSFNGRKDADGYYTVTLRRYNNHVLKA